MFKKFVYNEYRWRANFLWIQLLAVKRALSVFKIQQNANQNLQLKT